MTSSNKISTLTAKQKLMSLNMRRYNRMNQFVQVNLSKKRNIVRYQKKIQFTYTLFLVHLPYSINKAIRIYVLYHPWNHHFIILAMNMHQHIPSNASKNPFWKFIIKVGCTSVVIFLWGISNKKRKHTK